VLSPVANYDSPSCRDGTGPWIFLKEGLCTIIAGTGSGPEGSRPTAGNYRLQVYGEENATGLTGMQARWQPLAGLPFNSDGKRCVANPRCLERKCTCCKKLMEQMKDQ